MDDAQRPVAKLVEKSVCMRSRRPNAGAHGGEDLDESGGSRSRHQMPKVRFERTERDIARRAEHRADAPHLHRVADACSRGMALDERNVRRREPTHRICGAHRAFLPLLGGDEEPSALAVVGQTHAANDAQDAVRIRIGESLEDHHGAAMGRHQTIGFAMEGAAPPRGTERAQRLEAGVKKEIAGVVRAARDRDVRGPVVQSIARQLHRVERGSARRVQRKRAASASRWPRPRGWRGDRT